VNQAARALAGTGRVVRRPRPDGKIGNYLSDASSVIRVEMPTEAEIGVDTA
jgi:hypothetical protein